MKYYRLLQQVLALAMFGFGASGGAYAQACDENLKPISDNASAYKTRQGRCEGFYISTVSAPSLNVVSVIKGPFVFDLSVDEVVLIESAVILDHPIMIRAQGIPLKTYYRLDAQLGQGEAMSWPIKDVVLGKQLSSKKIGVYGWVDDGNQFSYIPVVTNSKLLNVDPDQQVSIYLRSSVDVEKVRWRYAQATDGQCSGLGDWQTTEKASYKSGKPIVVDLPTSSTGELCLEVAALEKGTNRWLKKNVHVLLGE